MGYFFTRRQLYEQVWAEPITVVAKALRVSDVGLAKACRRGAVPLPPRGYWAKRNAGQSVSSTLLPPRAPGASDVIEVGSGRGSGPPRALLDAEAASGETGSGARGDADTPAQAPPEPPIYDETLDQVKARIEAAYPKRFRVDRALDRPHPLIARLLQDDEARRVQQAKSGHSWDGPRFAGRFEQRRLCFLSNLLTLLFQFDVQPSIRGRDAREIRLRVGDSWIEVSLDATVKVRPRGRSAAKDPDREPLAIEIKIARWKHGEAEERLFWCDGEAGKLENQLREIAITLVWAGERQLRKGRQFFYEMDCRTYQQEIEQEKQRRADAEQRARDRLAQAEADRVTRLLAQVNAHQQAHQIRHYVKQVTATPTAVAGRAFDGDRQTWTTWALALADQLDPLMPGRDSALPPGAEQPPSPSSEDGG